MLGGGEEQAAELGDFAGFLGFLFQIALIAGLIWLVLRLVRGGSPAARWWGREPVVGAAARGWLALPARPQVLELLRGEVAKVNATLPEPQRIRDFVLLYKELDADDEELTRTRKVRRGVIGQKYGGIIEAIYRGDKAIPVDTTIAFQDGTKQRIRTTLAVVSAAEGAAAPLPMAAE